jgi:RNA polymerase sigma-70 factor (ECF subfamily)
VAIEEGLELVRTVMCPASHAVGPYALQAAIAGEHARAATAEETDWAQIAHLYGGLERAAPSPVVTLNRAVAVAMAEGPEAGLEIVDAIEGLDAYQHLHAARADLLRRLGRCDEAAAAYRNALELTANEAERVFLEARLAAVSGSW